MLIGRTFPSLDEKGRTIISSKMREDIGDAFVITKGFDKCLQIFSIEQYEQKAAKYMAMPDNDEDARFLKQEILGNACECTLDKQGRFLVPAYLRQAAGFVKDLVLIGVGTHANLWAVEELEAYNNGTADGSQGSKDIAQASKNLAEKGIFI